MRRWLWLMLIITPLAVLPAFARSFRPDGIKLFDADDSLIIPLPLFSQVAAGTVYIEEGEVKIYLKRAEEYEKAGKWREAIEQYFLALKKHPDAVYETSDKYYAGIKYYFYRQLLKYPEELAVYRQMYDATSEALYSMAVSENNEPVLRRIINEMFFASYGDDAANTLADILAERGQIGEALLYWDMVFNLYPDTDLPKELICCKIATAARCLGDTPKYQEATKYLRERYADKKVYLAGKLWVVKEILNLLETLFVPGPNLESELKWTQWGGNRAHNLVPDTDAKNDIREWSIKIDPASSSSSQVKMYPWWYPVVVKDTVYLNAGSFLRTIELRSAKEKTTYPSRQAIKPLPSHLFTTPGREGMPYGHLLFSCAIEGTRLYANLLDPERITSHPSSGFTQYGSYLLAIETEGFRYRWDTKNNPDEVVKDVNLFSPPVVYQERVYSAGLKIRGTESQVYLFCFDTEKGDLIWKRFICSQMRPGAAWSPYYYPTSFNMPTIAESNGIVFCLTNAGVITAVSADSGDILWLVNYSQDITTAPPNAQRVVSYPVVYNNVVYITPLDTKKLYGFDTTTGRQKGGSSKSGDMVKLGDGLYIIGCAETSLIMIDNNNQLWYYNLKDNKFESDRPHILDESPVGRCFITKQYLYIPTAQTLRRIRIHNRKLVDSTEWFNDDDAGNLVVVAPYLLMASANQISLHIDGATKSQEFDRKLEPLLKQPDNPNLMSEYTRYIKRMIENRQYLEAIQRLRQIIGIIDQDRPDLKGGNLEKESREQLGFVYLLQGNEDMALSRTTEAITNYRQSLVYVGSNGFKAETLLNLGNCLSKNNNYKEAVQFYQQALTECPDEYYSIIQTKPSRSLRVQTYLYAADKISRIISGTPEAYEPIQSQASQAYGKINQNNSVELAEFLKRYPHSYSAREAFAKLAEMSLRENNFTGASYYLTRQIRQSGRADDVIRPANQLLEHYQKRQMFYSLQHLARYLGKRFPKMEVNIYGRKARADEYTTKYFSEISNKLWQNVPPLKLPAELFYQKLGKGSDLPLPILPQATGLDEDKIGLRASFNNGLLYFRTGSKIEAYNPDKKKLVWTYNDLAHSLPQLGANFKTDKQGLVITNLNPLSPLQKAGVLNDDIINSIDHKPVKDIPDLINVLNIALRDSKSEVKVALLRVASGTNQPVKEAKEVNLNLKILESVPLPSTVLRCHTSYSGDIVLNCPDCVQEINGLTGQLKWIYYNNSGKIANILIAQEHIYLTVAINKPHPKNPDKLNPFINRLVCLSRADGVILWEIESDENEAEPLTLAGHETLLVRYFPTRVEIIDTATGEIIYRDEVGGGLQPGPYESRSSATTFDKIYYIKGNNLIVYDVYKRQVKETLSFTPGSEPYSRWLSASDNLVSLSFRNSVQMLKPPASQWGNLTPLLSDKMSFNLSPEFQIRSVTTGNFLHIWNTAAIKTTTPRTTAKLVMTTLDGAQKIKWITPFDGMSQVEIVYCTPSQLVLTTRAQDPNQLKIMVLDTKSGRLLSWGGSDRTFTSPPNITNPVVVFNGHLVITTTDGVYVY